jgi:hypothetical protein
MLPILKAWPADDPIHEKPLRRSCQEPSFARQRRM